MDKIGLQAILDMADFDRGSKSYISQTDAMDTRTTALGKAMSGMGNVIGTTAKVVAGAGVAAFGALAAVIATSIGPASDLSESMNKATVVFAENAGAIKAWSATSATAMGMSQQQALEAAGTYGNLFRAMGLSGEAATTMSMDMVQLAADLGSFNNIPIDVALEKLRAGLTGEAEPLKALGINMNEATLKTEALRLGLIKSTKEALDPAAKAQAAYSLIMQQSALAQGDFARTSDGFANQQKIIAAQIENLRAKIGTAFLPVLGKLTGKFSEIIDKYGPQITAAFEAVAEAVGGVVEFVLNFIDQLGQGASVWDALSLAMEGTPFESLRAGFDGVRAAIEQVWSWVNANLVPVFQTVTAFVEQNLKPILAGLAAVLLAVVVPAFTAWATAAYATAAANLAALAPILIPIAAIGAAVGLLVAAWENNWFGIRDTLTAVWENTLRPALETLWEWLKVNIPIAIQALSDFWNNTLLPALQAVWQFIQANLIPIFETVWNWLATNIPPAIQALANFWNTVLLPAIQAVWQFIDTKLVPLFTALANVVIALVKKEVEALAGLWEKVLKPALETVWKFINEKVVPIFETVWSVITEKIIPAFQRVADFISVTLGPVLQWLKDNILGPVADAFGNIGSVIEGIIGWLQKLADAIGNINLGPFTPGSPTPFEIGLLGIASALKKVEAAANLSALTVPIVAEPVSPPSLNYGALSSFWQIGQAAREFSRSWVPPQPPATGPMGMTSPATLAPATVFAAPAAASGPVVTVQFGDVAINNGMDLAAFKATVLSTVSDAMQGYS